MGNEATKLEIGISDEPFKPGDWIDGEVVTTTTKPLKDISGIDVRFEGGSWYAQPGKEIDREVYVDQSINLPVEGSQLKRRGQHRFAFSFFVPEGCKSSVVFSRFGWTKYSIVASLQHKGVDVCGASRNVTILAPPMEPAEDGNNNNGTADGDESNEIARPPTGEGSLFVWKNPDPRYKSNKIARPRNVAASPPPAERSLIVWRDPNPRYNHLPVKCAAMKLELKKRVFQPGDYISIHGTFHLDTERTGPFDIKASLGFIVDRAAPTSPAAEEIGGEEGQHKNQAMPEEKWMGQVHGNKPVDWYYGEDFYLQPMTPTESSLFHRFRNRRCLIIAMEQCKNPAGGKPKRLEVKLPIQIGH